MVMSLLFFQVLSLQTLAIVLHSLSFIIAEFIIMIILSHPQLKPVDAHRGRPRRDNHNSPPLVLIEGEAADTCKGFGFYLQTKNIVN